MRRTIYKDGEKFNLKIEDMKSTLLFIIILCFSLYSLGQSGNHFRSTTYELIVLDLDEDGNEIQRKILKPDHFHIGVTPKIIYINYDNCDISLLGLNNQILTITDFKQEKGESQSELIYIVTDENDELGIFLLTFYNDGKIVFNYRNKERSVTGFIEWI